MSHQISRVYDAIARGFAARFSDVPSDLLPLMDALISEVGPQGLIADIGCGHGRDVAYFERRRRVIGIDLSLGMLRQARQVTSCALLQMDMSELGLRDCILDGIWCCAALLHVPKSEAPRVLDEFGRALRTNGMLVVSVQQGTHDAPRHSEFWGVDRHFSDYQPGEMAALLQDHGFVVVSQASRDVGSVTWLQTVGLAAKGE
jgi:SAM-dependent methyltransferase